MYLDRQETEFSVLKQGDVLENIHILGAINLMAINYGISTSGEQVSWQIVSKPIISHAIILSHSCEIDPQNKVKLTSIILAPLRDLNKATRGEKIDELIKSNYINDSTEYSYLKYFYLEPIDTLPFSGGAVADYSKCFSVRNQSYDLLLKNKVLQLTEETVNQLALKLALYFYRD